MKHQQIKFWSLHNLWLLLCAGVLAWNAYRQPQAFLPVAVFGVAYGLFLCVAHLRAIRTALEAA